MSHIVCPMCGLSVPMSKFWDTIDDPIEDIEAVSFIGLGRGRGFEKTDAYSILEEEGAQEAIVSRCYAILELLGETFEEEEEEE